MNLNNVPFLDTSLSFIPILGWVMGTPVQDTQFPLLPGCNRMCPTASVPGLCLHYWCVKDGLVSFLLRSHNKGFNTNR